MMDSPRAATREDDAVREVVVVCPQDRDRALIRAAALDNRYRVRFAGPDLDSVTDFDPGAFVDQWTTVRADGLIGTKDRSALLASLLGERLGLTTPKPDAVINCQHKGQGAAPPPQGRSRSDAALRGGLQR